MKELVFNMTEEIRDIVFPPNKIKTKVQILSILLRTTRYMMIYDKTIVTDMSLGQIVLKVNKMSRLYFFMSNKYYTIHFPFTVILNNNMLNFAWSSYEIDFEFISKVLVRIESAEWEHPSIYNFADCIIGRDKEDIRIWQFVKFLMQDDDGYMRYDYDIDGFKKDYPYLHPVNHLHVQKLQATSFRLGLDKELGEKDFIDITDTTTNCWYLIKH